MTANSNATTASASPVLKSAIVSPTVPKAKTKLNVVSVFFFVLSLFNV